MMVTAGSRVGRSARAIARAMDHQGYGAGASGFFHPQARLTLSTGVAVPSSDVTAATTLYYTPFMGNRIALYSGAAWESIALSQISASLSGLTANLPYDVFVYDNLGSLALDLVAWTNGTTRATALATQDGAFVKSGATGRLYVGTILITGTAGQCEDSRAFRGVWNAFNRVPRPLRAVLDFGTHTYSTQTWREMNNSSANRIRFVCGLSEAHIQATGVVLVQNSTASARSARMALALDTTSAPNDGSYDDYIASSATNTVLAPLGASWIGLPGIGSHYISMLQYAEGTDTQTWFGVFSAARRHGISATMEM